MSRFARGIASIAVLIGIGSAVVLIAPGVALASGCSTVSHTVNFGGYNKDTLSAQLCWNASNASIGHVSQSCQVTETFADCDGHSDAIYGNNSGNSATVYGTFYGSGPDNSYEAVIRITIDPGGKVTWGSYYIREA
jgi:hypothetical protein